MMNRLFERGTLIVVGAIAFLTLVVCIVVIAATAATVNEYAAASESYSSASDDVVEPAPDTVEEAPSDEPVEPEPAPVEPEPAPVEPVVPVAPEPAPVAPAVVAPTASNSLAATCADLYSPTMRDTLGSDGLSLSSGTTWSSPGTTDSKLGKILGQATDRLECSWHPSSGTSTGIETVVVKVTGSQGHDVRARLQKLGFIAKDELGGTRYFIEGKNKNGTAVGESHIVINGWWYATRWVEYGPKGYTGDMVEWTQL